MTSQSFDVASWVPETIPNVNDIIRVRTVSPLTTEFVPYTLGSTVPGPPGPAGPAGPAGPPGSVTGAVAEAPIDGTPYERQDAGWVAASPGGVTSFNARTGAVTLTNSDVTTALGYTPYDTTNPAGYQTAAQVTASLVGYLPLTGGALTGRLTASASQGLYFDAGATVGFNSQFAGYLSVYGQTLFQDQVFVQPPAGNAVFNIDGAAGSSGSLVIQGGAGGAAQIGMDGPAASLFAMKSASGACQIGMERTTGQQAQIYSGMGASVRWSMVLADTVAETGANAGSNFSLSAYNDAGVQISTPFAIERATGIATFAQVIVNGPSDRTLKGNIAPLTDALAKVQALQGVSFTMLDTPDKPEIGLIAQDVQTVVPEVIQNYQHFNKDTKESEPKLAIDYPKLVALLIESVKELSANVTSLQAEVTELRAR